MKSIFIYGLIDPRNGDIRYVGKTVSLKNRLRNHIWAARSNREHTHKARWIRILLGENLKPDIVVLTDTDDRKWEDDERSFIAKYRPTLTNIAEGGNRIDVKRTPEWNAKIGAAHRGKIVSQETRQRLREINLAKYENGCKNGHPWTEESTCIAYKNGQSYRSCRICRNENARTRRHEKGLKGRSKFRKTKDNPQEFCKRGHLIDGENLRICYRKGGITERICRECVKIRNRSAKKTTLQRAMIRTEPANHKSGDVCKNGHLWTEENTSINKYGYRSCKECNRYMIEKVERR